MIIPKERTGFWSGTLFGTFLGAGSLLAYQYFSGILRQPRLILKEMISDEGQFENRETLAVFIAAENLRSGIHIRTVAEGLNKKILHAGYRNFRESWARDFGFASFGLIALEEFEVVRNTLEAFFWHQTSQGQLPVKLHSISTTTRFFYSLLGREQPTEFMLKPKYISGHGAPSLDGQALLVIAACNYAQETGDFEFLQKHWRPLKLALHWLQLHCDQDEILLNQSAYADWADSIARRGNILYTNILYWKALSVMGLAATSLDMNQDSSLYMAEAESLSRKIHETGDFEFLQKHWRPLKLALHWLQLHCDQDEILLNQSAYADWADSIARRGNILYTNILYWKALSVMGLAATSLDLNHDSSFYMAEAEGLSRKIHETFWRSDLGYFVTSDRLDQLSSDGNLLAIAWGLASPTQAESILKVMAEAEMAKPVPTRVVHPPYPNYLVAIENILGGLANYHTTASWLWLGAWHAIALAESDRLEDAQTIMERIIEVIVRDRRVIEVHGSDGKPLQSIWYKSESPLTWNAAMVLYAYKTLETKLEAPTGIISLFSEKVE